MTKLNIKLFNLFFRDMTFDSYGDSNMNRQFIAKRQATATACPASHRRANDTIGCGDSVVHD